MGAFLQTVYGYLALAILLCAIPASQTHAELFSYSETVMSACDDLRGKTFATVAEEVDAPYRMLYLCESGGIIWPVKGTATAADSTDGQTLMAPPFTFQDDVTAVEAGQKLENYNIWFSTDTQFGLRIANYTDTAVSKIVVGFKRGHCGGGPKKYEKFMVVIFNPVAPEVERVVKWRIPPDLMVASPSCLDILKASDDL